MAGTSYESGGGDVLLTWAETRELYALSSDARLGSRYPFETVKTDLPPSAAMSRKEMTALHKMQEELLKDLNRQDEILRQRTANDMTEILRPLGIEEMGGFEDTISLMQTVLQLAERIGYVYKWRYLRERPNKFDPSLRPFIANPPHPAFPSNHAFQLFSVAHVMTRMLPENPACAELFLAAQRVGENREYAGLHFPSDTRTGEVLAYHVAPYLFHVCRHMMRDARAEWF